MPETISPEVANKLKAHMLKARQAITQKLTQAFHRGKRAADMKLSHTSTEYGDLTADEFFYAGYDGESWEAVVNRCFPVE